MRLRTAVQILKKPHPFQSELKSSHYFQIALAASVFLILWLFQPFDLHKIPENKFIIIIGYGVIAYGIVLLFFTLIPACLPETYMVQRWTVLKEILYISAALITGGTVNYIYTVFWADMPLNVQWYLIMIWRTVAVGIFPLVIYVLIRQVYLTKKYQREADTISDVLPILAPDSGRPDSIVFTSENEKEKIIVRSADLLYIVSRENYVEIAAYGSKLNRHLIRSSLAKIEGLLVPYPQLVRCHRSYIVNTGKIRRAEGNAQGLKLFLDHPDMIIPVARRYVDRLRKLIRENKKP